MKQKNVGCQHSVSSNSSQYFEHEYLMSVIKQKNCVKLSCIIKSMNKKHQKIANTILSTQKIFHPKISK